MQICFDNLAVSDKTIMPSWREVKYSAKEGKCSFQKGVKRMNFVLCVFNRGSQLMTWMIKKLDMLHFSDNALPTILTDWLYAIN